MDKLISQYNKKWHSPTNVYMHIQELAKDVGFEAINKKPQYQKVREAKISVVMAFILSKMRGLPTFLRFPLKDPPDVYLMQPNNGTMDIVTVEITSYRDSKESLLEQLKRTKLSQTYSYKYMLLVELLIKTQVDYDNIFKYKIKHKIDWPVWFLSKIKDSPDTIAEIVTIDSGINHFEINIGREAYYYNKQFKTPAIIYSKRAFKPKDVRVESNQKEDHTLPWEMLED
ncbi:MAG: hypothetical protein WC549_06585 [Actinomycetota bacterium]